MAVRLFVAAAAAALVLGALFGGSPGSVSAHERRVVGNYEVEVGFYIEPALTNTLNGVFMSVVAYPEGVPEAAAEEGEGAGGEPVKGLDERMTATVTVGGGAATKELQFEALEVPGTYVASFIPTLAGEYTFQVTGEIDGTQVDETFESGPNTFSSVQDAADYEFPAPSGGAGDASTNDDGDDEDGGDTTMIVAIVAIVLALIAVAVAVFAVAKKPQV